MRPPVVSLVVALAWLSVVISGATAHQHIVNGGFEAGVSGWSAAPNTDLALASAPEVAPAEGSASARIVLGDSPAIVRQRVAGALASGTYDAKLSARSPTRATVTLSILPAGTPQQFVVATEDVVDLWNEIGGSFSLNSAVEAVVSIVVSGAPGTAVFIDDVRLDGAPPVTLTPTPTLVPASETPLTGATLTSLTPAVLPSATATPTPVADAIRADVRNAGFEEIDNVGLPFAWEKFGGTLMSDGQAHGGARAARLESATAATKWLHQAVTVDPGSWYTLDAWILHDEAGVRAAYLRVSWYASGDASGTALSTADSPEALMSAAGGYRMLTTGPIAAPEAAHSARVRVMLAPVSERPARIIVDDVSWRRVPAPVATPPVPSATAMAPDVDSVLEEEVRSSPDRPGGGVSASRIVVDGQGIVGGTSGRVVLNEILYDGAGDIPDAEAEWVELYNAGDESVDIRGWTLQDGVGSDVMPKAIIPANGFLIVAATDAFSSAHPDVDAPVVVLGGRIGNALGNEGDRLVLVDAEGAAVDALSWGDDVSVFEPSVGDVPSGHSIERRTPGVDSDSAADFIDNDDPSPGRGYVATSADAGSPLRGGRVDVLSGSGARDWGWVPWAMAAASGAACVAMAGWRAGVALRDRMRHT